MKCCYSTCIHLLKLIKELEQMLILIHLVCSSLECMVIEIKSYKLCFYIGKFLFDIWLYTIVWILGFQPWSNKSNILQNSTQWLHDKKGKKSLAWRESILSPGYSCSSRSWKTSQEAYWSRWEFCQPYYTHLIIFSLIFCHSVLPLLLVVTFM